MSRRSEGQLFVGRLSKTTRVRDLEDIFEPYGRLARCDIKYGAEMAYAFVDFEDRRDGEDALRYENGRKICGSSIIVEWAKGNPRRPMGSQGHETYDECYRCHRPGHWARDCPDDRSFSRGGYRSPSPRRRRRRSNRSRSRSRSRSRRRSRSRSRERRKRSRSRSRSRSRDRRSKRSRRSRSRSRDRKKPVSKSRSRSRSKKKSVSRSKSRSKSRSPSRSPSAGQTNGDQEQEQSDRSRASSAVPSEPPSGSPPPADD